MFPILVKCDKATRNSQTVIVDYNAPIKSLLEKGRCKYAAPEICSENFPNIKKGREQINIKVINFKSRPILGDECFDRKMHRLEQEGNTPLDLCEFLTAFNKLSINPNSIIYALGAIIECNGIYMAAVIRKSEYPITGYIVGLEEV